jgi:hypothetical protein
MTYMHALQYSLLRLQHKDNEVVCLAAFVPGQGFDMMYCGKYYLVNICPLKYSSKPDENFSSGLLLIEKSIILKCEKLLEVLDLLTEITRRLNCNSQNYNCPS